MNRATGWLLALGVVLLLGAGIAWWLHNYDWVEEEITLPPRGMARYNPLYGLQRTLEALDRPVVARATLQPERMDLQPGELLVLGSDLRTLGEDEAQALLDWVESGGTLLFALPEGATRRNPPLLDLLGSSLVESSGCSELVDAARLCPQHRLLPGDLDFDWLDGEGDDTDGYLHGVVAWGAGRWAFAGDFDFLRGKALDSEGNVAIAWRLLGPLLPRADARIHLVYAVDMPPLHVLLVREGWPLLLPLLLGLLAWLWARASRLGPLRPLPPGDRRALSEHVVAAAEFVFRRGGSEALLAPLRRRLQQRLAQRHPAVAALDPPEQIVALSRLTGIDEARLRAALLPTSHAQAESFRAAVSTLLQIESTV